jgi:bacterioferritin-associated ferredoxin
VIICQCAVVTDRSVTEAVAAGAGSLSQVCRATDAGRDCGACVFGIKRIITEQRHGAACRVGDTRIKGGGSQRSSALHAKSA